MTKHHCLSASSFNVVIVGNGAIGSALLQSLLQYEGLHRAIVLGRSARSAPMDQRISFLPCDAEDPGSVMAAAVEAQKLVDRVHLLINTVGLLHNETQQPEKRLQAINPTHLEKSFRVNAVLLPLVAQAFGSLLRHDEPAVLASLSARVGSIEDNQLGGWYSYRATKAAHNMLLKTIAREWAISHRNVTVAALHPGTVRSGLSEPFLSSNYKNRVLTPIESATALLGVIKDLRPEESGSFYDWQGKLIPW